MSRVLASVDQRTKLVGENRLELLMFKLGGRQMFALNVFKIQEVLKTPALTQIPKRHPYICGVTHLRKQTISVIDLAAAIGLRPLLDQKDNCNIIVTEYNRSVQAFLVGNVDRIINLNWDRIMPPPTGAGRSTYLTAITQVDDQIVEILDVERVLADIIPYDTTVSDEVLDKEVISQAQPYDFKVLLVDDSETALSQARDTIKQLGIKIYSAKNGREGLRIIKQWQAEDPNFQKHVLMVVTDAEMPEMDGYMLTHQIRQDPKLADLFVALHTSLSGSFNKAMVEKVGCDAFLSKFQPDELAVLVQERLKARIAELAGS